MSARPRIGVTGPDRGGAAAWWLTRLALARAGASAVRVTPAHPAEIAQLDALVVGGGADIDPALYGGTAEALGEVVAAADESVRRRRVPVASRLIAPAVFLARKLLAARTWRNDADRDALEMRLLEAALARRLPVLGICRGAQLLNVVLGGTLFQDVAEFYVESPQVRTVLARKLVRIEPASRLAGHLGVTSCTVNALHHQAVRGLGRGLTVAAREPNGIVQAIEEPSYPFCIGVQWHPEYLPQHRLQQALFAGLVAAAA
ncbi:MAG: gamma-glutamyl-gamma-aminobutyrate hydrolase family protein [Polyangiaceae bacterium]